MLHLSNNSPTLHGAMRETRWTVMILLTIQMVVKYDYKMLLRDQKVDMCAMLLMR